MNDYWVVRVPRKAVGTLAIGLAATVCMATLPLVRGADAPAADKGGQVKALMSQSLPDIPGKDLTAVMVNYGPGGKSAAHRHAGDVFAFVVSGSIRSENSATGPARVYRAGEAFFEPAGSTHLVSENASATAPAQLLAVFVADAHAQLTTREKP